MKQVAQNEWTVRTRLVPPERRTRILPREKLLEQVMSAAPPPQIIFLDAPAGYGKTTFLVQLYDHVKGNGCKVAWLTLDEDDRLPNLFVEHLATAFDHGGRLPDSGQPSQGLTPRAALEAIINRIADMAEPLVLFLDDCHCTDSQASRRLVDCLIENVPPNMRIIMAGRGQGSAAFGRLEFSGLLRRVTKEELRFDLTEAQDHLEGVASGSEAEQLLEQTEGWPVALQLVRIWLSTGHHKVADLPKVSGRTTELARYLAEVVFEDLDADLRTFLQETSILERLHGDLVNEICGRSDAWQTIEELLSRSLFLEPVEQASQWFRYHPLFAEFLRQRLRREQPGREEQLRRKAARRLFEQGLWMEGLRQALKTGDLLFAAELVEESDCLRLIMTVGTATLAGFESMDTADLAKFPSLCLGMVYKHIQEGDLDRARLLMDLLTPMFKEHTGSRHDCSAELLWQYRFYQGVILAYEDRALPKELLSYIEDKVLQDPLASPLTRGEALNLITQAHFYNLDLKKAAPFSQRLGRTLDNLGCPYFECYSRLLCGLVAMAQGFLTQAENQFSKCLELAEREFAGDSGQALSARLLLALVQFERGDDSDIRAFRNKELLDIGVLRGWYGAYEAILPALISTSMSDQDVSESLMRLAKVAQMAETGDFHRLALLANTLSLRLMVRAGSIAKAEELLELPEIRRLRDGGEDLPPSLTCLRLIVLESCLRLDLVFGRAGEWEEILNVLKGDCVRAGMFNWRLRLIIAQSVVALHKSDIALAGKRLEEAILLAQEEEIMRPFLAWRAELSGFLPDIVKTRSWPAPVIQFLDKLMTYLGPVHALNGTEDMTLTGKTGTRPGLSRREGEVLELLNCGMTSKEIARELGISIGTVKGYRKELFQKLEVSSRSQAIQAGRAMGLIT